MLLGLLLQEQSTKHDRLAHRAGLELRPQGVAYDAALVLAVHMRISWGGMGLWCSNCWVYASGLWDQSISEKYSWAVLKAWSETIAAGTLHKCPRPVHSSQ